MFLPTQELAPGAFTSGEEIEGTVVDFSDSGSFARVFAVIEVVQKQTVIVPIQRLRRIAKS